MSRYPLLTEGANGRDLSEIKVDLGLPRGTTRRNLRQVRLHFDRVTDDMVEAFACGECALLALALHLHTGWPYLSVFRAEGAWNHVGVQAPDGRLVDIYGARTEREVLNAEPYKDLPEAFLAITPEDSLVRGKALISTDLDGWGMTPRAKEAVLYLAECVLKHSGYRHAVASWERSGTRRAAIGAA